MRRFVSVLIVTLIINQILWAGTNGKLAGNVIDAVTQEPIIGASITLEGADINCITDIDGEYYIINVPFGIYTMVLSHNQYPTIRQTDVSVIMDQTTRVNFLINKDTVKTKDNHTSGAFCEVQNFSKLAIAQERVIRLENNTQQIAGFEDQGGEEIHLRGCRSGEVGYNMDGMPIMNPFYGHNFQYTELNNSAVEELVLKSGVFDSEYSAAMSNMVTIITRDGGDNFEGNFKIQLSGPGRITFSSDQEAILNITSEPNSVRDYREICGRFSGPVPYTNNKIKFIISGHKTKSAFRAYEFDNLIYNSTEPYYSNHNKHLNKLDTIDGWRTLGFIDGWDVYSKLNWKISNSMKLSATSWNVKTKFRTFGMTDAMYQYYEQGLHITAYNYDRQSILFNHQLSENLYYDLRLAHSWQKTQIGNTVDESADSRFLDADEYEQPEDDTDWDNNPYWFEYYIDGHDRYHNINSIETYESFLSLLAQLTKRHQIKFGGSYRYHQIRVDNIECPWLNIPYSYKHKTYPKEAGLYIQDHIEYHPLAVNAGLRLDAFNDTKTDSNWEFKLSPRLKLTQFITDNFNLTFGYGKFFYNPAFSQIDGAFNQMIAYEVGANFDLSYGITTQLIGWIKDYSDMISPERLINSSIIYYTIDENAQAQGIDFILKVSSPRNKLILQYTLSRATTDRKTPWEGYRDSTLLIPKEEIFLSSDRTHDISLLYSSCLGNDQGIAILGTHPFEKTKLSMIYMAASGFPYTPTVNGSPGKTNSKRTSWYYITNLSLTKEMKLFGTKFILGMIVHNLFDRKNPITVWSETGNADDPGARFKELIDYGYYSKTLFDLPYMYGRRRQIDFTLEVSF